MFYDKSTWTDAERNAEINFRKQYENDVIIKAFSSEELLKGLTSADFNELQTFKESNELADILN